MNDVVRDDAFVPTEVEDSPGRNTRTISDLILEYLIQIDVDHIFGIPGGAIEPFFNAIARQERRPFSVSDRDFNHKAQTRSGKRSNSSAIKMVVARHEAGAAFMADGYSRVTGRLGVCCATTGPGTTNLRDVHETSFGYGAQI